MYYNQLYWNKAMRNESGLMKLHVNTSAIFGDEYVQNSEAVIHLTIGKTKTLGHLKQVISKKIGVSADDFTISR